MVLKGKKQKHKGHKSCEQNKNQGIPIIVEEERWDANRGIHKLGKAMFDEDDIFLSPKL